MAYLLQTTDWNRFLLYWVRIDAQSIDETDLSVLDLTPLPPLHTGKVSPPKRLVRQRQNNLVSIATLQKTCGGHAEDFAMAQSW